MADNSKDLPEKGLQPPVNGDCAVAPEPRQGKLAAALDYRRRGLSLTDTGKLMGVSRQAVSQMLKRAGVDPAEIEQFKRDKGLLLHAKQKMVLDSITQPVIDKMSGRDRFIALGITQDKIRDLESPKGGVSGETWLAVLKRVHQRPESEPVDVTPKKEAEDGGT